MLVALAFTFRIPEGTVALVVSVGQLFVGSLVSGCTYLTYGTILYRVNRVYGKHSLYGELNYTAVPSGRVETVRLVCPSELFTPSYSVSDYKSCAENCVCNCS